MICGNMGRSLLPHPKPVRRKTSQLDAYYKNGIPITTAQIGDTITYDVPGHSPGTVYLVQNVNGQPGYKGAFTVPMSPFLLTPAQQTGLWANTVYDKDPAAGGSVIETDSLTINAATTTPTTPTGTTCPSPLVPYAGYTDANGNWNAPGCMYPKTTTTPTTKPTGTSPGSGTSSTSSTSTTSTTTTTTQPDGTAAPPNDTMLIVALAALAFVVLSK